MPWTPHNPYLIPNWIDYIKKSMRIMEVTKNNEFWTNFRLKKLNQNNEFEVQLSKNNKLLTNFLVQKSKKITINQAIESLDNIGIDKNGLEEMDRKILKNLISKFNGGPTGGKSLAISVNEDLQTIEDVYEPYLIKEGFIERTSRGRKATERAYKLFNIKKQENLFNDWKKEKI